MRFPRFILVLLLAVAGGGLFGASVGGLLGYAAPSSLKVFLGVEPWHLNQDYAARQKGAAPSPAAEGAGVRATVGLEEPQRLAAQGAAVGGAAGLILGVALGLALGALDQLLLFLRERRSPAGGGTPPSGAGPGTAAATESPR